LCLPEDQVSGLHCPLGTWLGTGLQSLSNTPPSCSTLVISGLLFPQCPAVHSLLGSATGRYWRAIGRWEGEQGLPPCFQLLSVSLKQQKRAMAPASSFFWPPQTPCNVPSEAQAPACCTPRGGQSTSQATVPSEVRASTTPPPRGPTTTSQAAPPSEVQAAAAQQPPERARHQPWGVPHQSF